MRGFAQLSGSFRRSDGHRANSAFQGSGGNVKLGWKLGEHFTVTLGGGGGHIDFENPQQVGGPPPTNKTGEIDYFSGYTSLVGRFARSETSIKAYWLNAEVEFNEGKTREPNTLIGAKVKETLYLFKGNILTLGTDVTNYSASRNQIDPDSITEGAPYLFVEQTLTEAFEINGGVRVTFNEQFGTDVSHEGGLVFKPFHGTALRARVARGFRAPNFFELDFLAQASQDLEPSSLVQYEVGINQQVGDWLTLDLVGFLQDGDNIIRKVPDPTAVGEFRFANTGEFFHKGLEAQADLLLRNDLSLFAAATILDLEDDTALTPHNTFDFGVGYTPGNFSISLTSRYINRLFNEDNSQDRIADSFVADARLSYRFWNNFQAFVEIDNFTDEAHERVKGFPLPGIGAFAGVSATF